MLITNGYIGSTQATRIYLGGELVYENEPAPPSEGITLSVQFDGTPSSISIAPLKYNKRGVLSLDWDDGVMSSLTANTLFQSTTYDDGTGAQIPWRAGVAVIGRSSFNDAELGNTASGALQYSDMLALIADGWDIQNHGLYSNTGGNFSSDTPLDDVVDLDTLILDRIGYIMATTVVPSNENGYVEGADTAGHLGATSQNDNVGGSITPYPSAQWQPITDIATWPQGFKYLIRQFTDSWDVSSFQDRIDDLIDNSSPTVNKLLRIGTHDSSPTGFEDFVAYIQDNAEDKLWVCSMRELLEYLKLRDMITVNSTENTITLDFEADDNMRWEDVTLLVEGATVVSATSSDADSVTFSSNQINVYKDKY